PRGQLAPVAVEPLVEGGVPEASGPAQRAPGGRGPRPDRPVVAVAGDAVGPEGDDRVRPDPLDEVGDLRDGGGGRQVRERAVGVAEPVVLVDPEDGQGLPHLAGAQGAQPRRGQAPGSAVPSSPQVAVTTTRSPAATAEAMSAPER